MIKVFDSLSPYILAGAAIDPSRPESAAVVSVRIEGSVLGRFVADLPSPDGPQFTLNGRHARCGFEIDLVDLFKGFETRPAEIELSGEGLQTTNALVPRGLRGRNRYVGGLVARTPKAVLGFLVDLLAPQEVVTLQACAADGRSKKIPAGRLLVGLNNGSPGLQGHGFSFDLDEAVEQRWGVLLLCAPDGGVIANGEIPLAPDDAPRATASLSHGSVLT